MKILQTRSVIGQAFFIFLMLIISSCVPQQKADQEKPDIPFIRVFLGQKTSVDTLFFEGTYFMVTEEARYEFGSSNKRIFVEPLQDGFKIFNENRLFLFRPGDEVVFKPDQHTSDFTINGYTYSGACIILKSDSSTIDIINETDVEAYLKGVVPAEIFTNNDDLTEAVKAQAICARTYALRRMKSNAQKKFHVKADVRDQVYRGKTIRTPIGNDAVEQTSGTVLMDNQSLAVTYYHSTCGGVLEAAENVWPGATYPYLNTRQDVIGREFADKNSPFYHWTEFRTAEQLDSLFRYNLDISQPQNTITDTLDIPMRFAVKDRTSSGRVKTLSAQYGTERKDLKGYEIRRFLGWPAGTLLPSTLFRLSANDTSLVIEGAGNGHGVGMCQYGAMYKARKGLQYYHILQSYFPGTVLKKVY